MIRTKPSRATKSGDQWWIGMEFMPGQFGLVQGPFKTRHDMLSTNPDHHHCGIYIRGRDKKIFLTDRKTTGTWKAVKKKEIRIGPQKPKKKRSRK